MFIDLQIHSTYSDGYFTPTQLAEFMRRQGVKVAALTDHNTVGGVHEFVNACRRYGIKPVKGLELYCKFHGRRFNILWYNFDETDPELHDMLRQSQERRRRYARVMLSKMPGFRINIDKILDRHNHYVPINHIVDAICADHKNLSRMKRELKTDFPGEGEIISRYFQDKNIGVLKNSLIDFERVIGLRKKIGGQLILCHPAKGGHIDRDFLASLKSEAMDATELMSPHHSYNSIMLIQRLAREFNLITTGGSDFHRMEGKGYRLQKSWEYFKIDVKYLRKVDKIIG